MENFLRILSCSWPRPVRSEGRRWVSEPEWDAPLMPGVPEWSERHLDGAVVPSLDWRDRFARELPIHSPHRSGEMKEFHVVFRLRAERGGTLVFHDDDGCIVRNNGHIVHEDRDVHALARHELSVRAGDQLEIAQWQYHGDWLWCGRVVPAEASLEDDIALFEPFLAGVGEALRHPNGPTLKTYFAADHPVRAALAIYSVVLNGYRPDGIRIYGDYQWNPRQRRAVEALLPFAEIVPTDDVLRAVSEIDHRLAPLACSLWSAMKICVSLFLPPHEYCFIDDDVFVLDRMDDALLSFRENDLVYAPDNDYEDAYRRIWNRAEPLSTGNINTGVYFARNSRDVRAQAERLVSNPPNGHIVWLWEQGFVATEFADRRTTSLVTQRYFYPVFDGLPGGLLGYDWRANPCGFVTTHFGGLHSKPTDDDSRALAREILGRHRACMAQETRT